MFIRAVPRGTVIGKYPEDCGNNPASRQYKTDQNKSDCQYGPKISHHALNLPIKKIQHQNSPDDAIVPVIPIKINKNSSPCHKDISPRLNFPELPAASIARRFSSVSRRRLLRRLDEILQLGQIIQVAIYFSQQGDPVGEAFEKDRKRQAGDKASLFIRKSAR